MFLAAVLFGGGHGEVVSVIIRGIEVEAKNGEDPPFINLLEKSPPSPKTTVKDFAKGCGQEGPAKAGEEVRRRPNVFWGWVSAKIHPNPNIFGGIWARQC